VPDNLRGDISQLHDSQPVIRVMARLKKHFEMLRAIRSRDFVSAEMAICKCFNDINNHNANTLQDCLEKDNGLNLYYIRINVRISNINSRSFLHVISIALFL